MALSKREMAAALRGKRGKRSYAPLHSTDPSRPMLRNTMSVRAFVPAYQAIPVKAATVRAPKHDRTSQPRATRVVKSDANDAWRTNSHRMGEWNV